MSLLQIQEPDAPPPKTKPRLALGIDLGTTNSLVAVAGDDGQCQTIPDDEGRMLMPSLVHYDGDGRVSVGIAAKKAAGADSKSVIASVKRLMGRSSLEVSDNYRYNYATGDGMVKITTTAGTKSPVEISAEILRSLAQRAEKTTGEQVAGVIITVPAYFDEAQRQATKTAAELAGLRVLRLLNEPTAAAIAYGLDNVEEGIYAIYDLGGGTFDISILHLQLGVFEVLATGGDTALGGDDYDCAIAVAAAKKMNLSEPSDEEFIHLTAAARCTKEALTEADTAVLQVMLNGNEKTCTISATELAELGNHLTNKTIAACRSTLADAGLTAKQLNGVVLVGGATRMRSVHKAVAQFFGKSPYTGLDPERAVALGAAAQADVLIGNRRSGDWLLLDVIPLSLGLEIMGGLVEKIIHRNSAIPVSRSQEFTIHQDGQTMMSIHALQGERELVTDCRSLAKFTLSGIPPMAAGQARIRVDFQVDADGLLSVTATEKNTGTTAQTTVKPSYGLDEAQISEMLTNAFNNAGEDAAKRRLYEARQEATTLVQLSEKALNEDGELLLNAGEHTMIKQALVRLKSTISADDAEKIKTATEMLNNACIDFAKRRMSADILRVIGGKSVTAAVD